MKSVTYLFPLRLEDTIFHVDVHQNTPNIQPVAPHTCNEQPQPDNIPDDGQDDVAGHQEVSAAQHVIIEAVSDAHQNIFVSISHKHHHQSQLMIKQDTTPTLEAPLVAETPSVQGSTVRRQLNYPSGSISTMVPETPSTTSKVIDIY